MHRQAIAEVYLTDCAPVDDNHFLVGAQWPRLHAFYRTCTGRYDTMLLAETVRQCAIYLAHNRYAVPLHYKFTMQTIRVDAYVDLLTVGPTPAEVTIDTRVTETSSRHGVLSAFTVTLEFSVDGQIIGKAAGVANVLSPAAYEHARWRGAGARPVGPPRLTTPVDADTVCVADPSAVVLGTHAAGPGSGMWSLRCDLTHPVLFDHPLDHVPGALILEAARQSARLQTGQSCADVEYIELGFRRFLELDEPVTVTARMAEGAPSCVEVEFSQWGDTHATGTVQLATPSHDRVHALSGTQRA